MPSATTTRPTLAAEPRDVLGKKVARLRRAGQLPGVVFGHGARFDERQRRRPRLRAAPPPGRAERPRRPVGRRQEGPAGPHPRRPGPPGHPPAAPRRPVPRPDDRGADRRRAARPDRRRRSPSRPTAARSCTASSRSGSGRCPITCPQSIEYSIECLVDFDAAIHVRDLDDPVRRDAPDRSRRGRRQGPGAARRGRGGAGRRRGRGGAEGEPRARPRARPARAAPTPAPSGVRRRRPRARPDASRPDRRAQRRPGAAGRARRAVAPRGAPRSAAEQPLALVAARGSNEVLLVELGEEPDVAVDRERCSSTARVAATSRKPARRSCAAAAVDARRSSPRRSSGSRAPMPISSSTSSRLDVRLERAIVDEPRHVGQRAARPQDPARLAEGPRPVRDELEARTTTSPRRTRRRRTAARRRSATRVVEPAPVGRREEPVGLARRPPRPSRATRRSRRPRPSGQRRIAAIASVPVPVPMSSSRRAPRATRPARADRAARSPAARAPAPTICA